MRTILIVDDDADFRDLLQSVLGACGFNVFAAASSDEALSVVAAHELDVVLTDYQMPGMDGLELCRTLRDQNANRGHQFSIWLMTGSPELSTEKAFGVGACGVFRKPFLSSHVAKAIHHRLDVTATHHAR